MFLFLFLIGFSNSVLFGSVPEKSEISSQVTIFAKFRGGNEVICGGVRVSKLRILTAAHCLKKAAGNAEIVEIQEIAGRSYWTNAFEILENDKAILHLNNLLHNTEIAKPSPIPNNFAKTCYAAGRGIDESNKYPELPRKIEIDLKFKRNQTFAISKLSFPETQEEPRFCMGDSGSPVYCRVKDQTVLIGILSSIGIGKREARTKKAQIFGAKTMAQKCANFRYAMISRV
ncbi:unnamed protein product [Caenorhabditis angaria]|uniref:Peptidase S1 domain-containing protein n=1 Tax=Caenorhabditis angaria TaxID=860376 RepID=A0A9P1J019_9PELO|nr:unnamed protein product [Caenorhabditis angaria]